MGPEVAALQRIVSRLDLSLDNPCVEANDPFLLPRLRFNSIMPHAGAQTLALCDSRRDVFFGGEGGSGKSRVLILAALQFADVPGYNALFLRKNFADLVLPGAALDVAHELLDGMPGVTWKGSTNTFLFDTGTDEPGSLTFAHLSDPLSHEKYRGAELQSISIDEITHLPEAQALFLFQRLRRPANADGKLLTSKDGLTIADVPLRYRAAANPGGKYVEWVKTRYVDEETKHKGSVHYRMTRADNPSIDSDEYELSLSYLDEAERRRMQHGDWSATEAGKFFDRTWFKIIGDYPRGARLYRYWDCAATKKVGGNDPDYTVGLLGTYVDGVFYIVDIVRERVGAAAVESLIEQTAISDPDGTTCCWEEEGGSNGRLLSVHRKRRLAELGVHCKPVPVSGTGSKASRARPLTPVAEAGNVRIVKGPYVREFLNEAHRFDGQDEGHDDQIDAMSGCFRQAAKGGIHVATRQAEREMIEQARLAELRRLADVDPDTEPVTATPAAVATTAVTAPAAGAPPAPGFQLGDALANLMGDGQIGVMRWSVVRDKNGRPSVPSF